MNSMLVNWRTSIAGLVLIVVGALSALLNVHVPGFSMDAGAAITAGIGLLLAHDARSVKSLIALFILPLLLIAGTAQAADVAAKSTKTVNPFAGPYTTAVCGGYYGLNSVGLTSSVTTASVGTQTVQGAVGVTVGYGCPINAADGSFWFVEGMFDVANLNGSTNGLSLSGPAVFTQRVGVGTPLNNMLAMIPGLGGSSTPAVPALPALPNGVTSGPGAPYLFAAIHEQDISAQIGLSQNQQWMISGGLGIGVLYRLSNGVVADTFAEYKVQSNSICVGPANTQCAALGSGVMAGFELKY